ncbi:MAG: glycosyltransferase family 39 protein, partial [Lachnospiraceae bacterium]|nr:glycosyltransferase family 39 protein [Lachnospiraceae bacterium]
MKAKKSWYSYIVWFAYAALCSIIFACYVTVFVQKVLEDGGPSQQVKLGLSAVAAVALLTLCFVASYLVTRKLQRSNGRRRLDDPFAERLCFSAVVAGAFALRAVTIFNLGNDFSFTAAVNNPDLFSSLKLYSGLTSAVSGNLVNALMQAVFQIVAIICVYFSVKRISGRVPAVVASGVLAFTTLVTEKLTEQTPECFLFMMFSIVLLVTVNLFGNPFEKEKNNLLTIAVISGVLTGLVISFSPEAVILPVIMLYLIMDNRTGDKNKFREVLISFLLYLLVTVVALLLFVAVGSFIMGSPVNEYFVSYKSAFMKVFERNIYFYSMAHPLQSFFECAVIVFLAALYIPGFWGHKSFRSGSVMLALVAIATTPVSAVGIMLTDIYCVFLWGIMAGIGLQSCIVHNPEEVSE